MTVTVEPMSFGKNTETLRRWAQQYLMDAYDVARICCVSPAMARAWLAGEKAIPARQLALIAHFVGAKGMR